MSNISSNIGFNLDGFERIEDIIFLDQPILTHLIKNGRDYFKYLVDLGDDFDLFLLLEIDRENLVKYITKKETLYSVITDNSNIGVLIKENFEGIVIDTEVINTNQMPEDYLPETDSFLGIDYSGVPYYRTLIADSTQERYLHELRNRAFYIKFDASTPKYGTTIGFMELTNSLLNNISSSYRSFASADFAMEFRDRIGDSGRIKSTFKALSKYIDPRVVNVAYSSFEIAIAVDKVMNDIEDAYIKQWVIEIADKYKNTVLDVDISSSDVDKIKSKYHQNDIKKIFNPIIAIANNQNVNFKIKDNKHAAYKKYILKEYIKDEIIPKSTFKIEAEKDLEIVNLTVAIDKNDRKTKSINIGKTLFSATDSITTYINNKTFEILGLKLEYEISIPVYIETLGGYIKLSAEYKEKTFTEVIDSDDLNQGVLTLAKQIVKELNT